MPNQNQTLIAPTSSLVPSTQNLNEYKQKLIDKKATAIRVKKMLACFPDYGKAQPEYVAAITETFEFYSDEVQARLAHPVLGLTSRFDFIPTVRQVQIMASEFVEAKPRYQPPQQPEKIISPEEQERVARGLKVLSAQLLGLKEMPVVHDAPRPKRKPLLSDAAKAGLARVRELMSAS